jgi:hypothetical protein
MQCPVDFIAISLLTVTASIIGAGCGIKPKQEDDWLVIPNLWGCLIGSPGAMKSPAASVAIDLIQKLEDQARNSYLEELQAYENELEIYKIQREATKSEISKAHKKNLLREHNSKFGNIDHLKESFQHLQEPEKPKRTRFKSNDATVEKLSEILSENPRGLLLVRDELMGLLTAWDKIGREGDRAFFLEAWNGKGSHTTDRIGRGTVDTKNMCVSILGTTQPDKLMRYLYGALNGNNDGLVQRFQLLIYPDQSNWKLVDRKPNQQTKEKILSIIHKLAHIDFSQFGASKDKSDEPFYFRFDEMAQEIFYQWLTDLENRLRANKDSTILMEHLSKYRKLMPALALIFHLIDLADGKQEASISEKNAQMACAWCEYLESHARRIYALVTDIDLRAAASLSEKILKGKLKDRFTVRDVYRQKGLLKSPKIAKSACEELVDAGWIREIVKPKKKGHKEQIIYLINPKIKGVKNHG